MERTVPTRASDEIDLYLRTIYSLLRSTTRVRIRTLEEVHAGMNSSLHPMANQLSPMSLQWFMLYCGSQLASLMSKLSFLDKVPQSFNNPVWKMSNHGRK